MVGSLLLRAAVAAMVALQSGAVEEECMVGRMGYKVPDLGDLRAVDSSGAKRIVEAVKEYGVVVLESEIPLNRREQVELSSKLGEVVILPSSFEGQDPEPNEPAIQRVTNYWSNGTWKGKGHAFGTYWHQDGQFWPRSHRWIISMLSCAAAPSSGGETGFADLRESFKTLDQDLADAARQTKIAASVRSIPDFIRNAIPAELDLFDDVEHPMVDSFPGSEGSEVSPANVMLYVGSPQMTLVGANTSETFIPDIIQHATQNIYYHKWKPGDVVIWDNVQTLHKAHPYNNTEGIRRELYRTQFRLEPTKAHLDILPESSEKQHRWIDSNGKVKWLTDDGQLKSVE